MIEFNAIRIVNALDSEAPRKYYAKAVKRGEVSLNTLAREISQGTSLATSDIHAALYSLLEIIPRYLTKGFYVKLGDFGTFFPSLRSVVLDTPDLVTTASIKKVKVMFRPGAELAYSVGQAKLQKSALPKEAEEEKKKEKKEEKKD